MAQINLGKIKPLWRGAYSAATPYKPLDFVSYNGLIYICTEVTTGNVPTNTAFWDTIVDGLGTAVTYDVTETNTDVTPDRLLKVGDTTAILNGVKAVDGVGSGLDADTVDGIHATAITQSGDSVTLTGDVTGSSTIASDGSISLTTTVVDNSHSHTLSTITDSGTAASYDVTQAATDTTVDRLLKVGDFGLGTGVTTGNEFSNNKDFNNFVTSGLYFIGGSNNSHTPLGLPTGAYSLLVNNNQASHNYIEHTATLISTEIPRKFFRCRINATWTDWKEIYHTGSTDITGSSSQTVGTQGADPFAIKTNNIERARVSSGGNYLIGTTTDNGVDKLQVNGSIQFKPATVSTPTNNGDLTVEATSNTEVKIKLKGTDGVVRSVSLTLA